MSEEKAKEFIEKLQSDAELKEKLEDFIATAGFTCNLTEIRKVAWDLMMAQYLKKLPASEHWE